MLLDLKPGTEKKHFETPVYYPKACGTKKPASVVKHCLVQMSYIYVMYQYYPILY